MIGRPVDQVQFKVMAEVREVVCATQVGVNELVEYMHKAEEADDKKRISKYIDNTFWRAFWIANMDRWGRQAVPE